MDATTCSDKEPKGNILSQIVVPVMVRWTQKLKVLWGMVVTCFGPIRIVILAVFLAYIAIPIFLKTNPWILSKVVFSNIIRWPPFVNLSSPGDFGLNNTRNFYMDTEEDVRIGAWHKLPVSLSESKEVAWDKYEESLRSGKTIFLYLHGNSGTRGGYHRVQIYKFLSQLDAHVLTIDYRGFGDSTGTPSEEGVVHDAYFAYKWLKSKSNNAPIFIWGHSLGTGITTALSRRLCEEGDDPVGVILEAPFNNILEAAEHHPFSLPFRLLPWFKSIFIDSIKEHGIQFSSDENIMKVTPHILILHAEDDGIVPFHLGHKLYQKAKETRTPATGDVELVVFQGHHGYGHKHIFLAPELPDIIKKFMEKSYADAND
ncbi:monoacylglycerol lipase ABHD12-like [Pomacea canaliculata]|uniref:monoacylglycerol lipase ABHD12-like n=1 Tax=Pomacea canaliculata TaxID=400727 RepID=UPI000D73426C|nr:monoacylglycerol lipase ABHD12-like [Pomacea canaliculata]